MIRLVLFIFIVISSLFSKEIRVSFSDSSTVSYKGHHPAHDWEGISKRVKGGIICTDSTLTDCLIKVIIPLESFDSGNSGRDSNMLFHTESNKYPFVKFTSNSFDINEVINRKINLSGILDFHGNKKEILTDVEIVNNGNVISGKTEFSISLDDYKVDKPQLLFIPISDEIIVECQMFCGSFFLKNEEK